MLHLIIFIMLKLFSLARTQEVKFDATRQQNVQ